MIEGFIIGIKILYLIPSFRSAFISILDLLSSGEIEIYILVSFAGPSRIILSTSLDDIIL